MLNTHNDACDNTYDSFWLIFRYVSMEMSPLIIFFFCSDKWQHIISTKRTELDLNFAYASN